MGDVIICKIHYMQISSGNHWFSTSMSHDVTGLNHQILDVNQAKGRLVLLLKAHFGGAWLNTHDMCREEPILFRGWWPIVAWFAYGEKLLKDNVFNKEVRCLFLEFALGHPPFTSAPMAHGTTLTCSCCCCCCCCFWKFMKFTAMYAW